MAANRIMCGGAVRRGRGGGPAAALAVLALAAALAGCGGSERGPTTAVPDREGDAQILNQILGRQEAAVRAYRTALPLLQGPVRQLALRFQAQEEEHVDATVKALRGIGERAEPEAEAIGPADLRDQAGALAFLYELERATIEAENSAIGALTAPAARMTLASTMANQAQHLVWLRRALGATPAETVPNAFENGSVAAP
jgi:Ferritin-like domain